MPLGGTALSPGVLRAFSRRPPSLAMAGGRPARHLPAAARCSSGGAFGRSAPLAAAADPSPARRRSGRRSSREGAQRPHFASADGDSADVLPKPALLVHGGGRPWRPEAFFCRVAAAGASQDEPFFLPAPHCGGGARLSNIVVGALTEGGSAAEPASPVERSALLPGSTALQAASITQETHRNY